VTEEDSVPKGLAFKLVEFQERMLGTNFTVSFEDLPGVLMNLLEQLGMPGHTQIFDLIYQHTLPVTVLGSGCSSLVHKIGSLLHQLRLDCGFKPHVFERYCGSVLSILTDKGTEAGLARSSAVDPGHCKSEVNRAPI